MDDPSLLLRNYLLPDFEQRVMPQIRGAHAPVSWALEKLGLDTKESLD